MQAQSKLSLPVDGVHDPVLDFMRVLWTLDEGLQRLSRQMLSRIGVTGPQRMVLRLMAQFPGVSANVLAGILHLHASTVSGIVKRLEADALLVRIPNSRDGRSYTLQLTDAGRKVAGIETGTVEAAVRQMIGSVSEQELGMAKAALVNLSRRLGNELEAVS